MKLKCDVNTFDVNAFMDMLQKHMRRYDDRIAQLNLKPSALTRVVRISYALYAKLWAMQGPVINFVLQDPSKPRMLKIGGIWIKDDSILLSNECVIPTIPSLPSLRTLYNRKYKLRELLMNSPHRVRSSATNIATANEALSDAVRAMLRMVGEEAMREHWSWGKLNTAIRSKVKNFGRVTSLGNYVHVQACPATFTVMVEIDDQGSIGMKPFDKFTYFHKGSVWGCKIV